MKFNSFSKIRYILLFFFSKLKVTQRSSKYQLPSLKDDSEPTIHSRHIHGNVSVLKQII